MNPFTDIFVRKPKKNNFDLSHDRKFSLNMGDIVPILCQEVVPGDTFNLQSEHLMRLAPLASPVMHNINAYTHYFFVPNRILWDGWEDFITGGEDGYQSPLFPTIKHEVSKGSVHDYLGLPVWTQFAQKFSALPLAGYLAIYNEYYRDQNLQQPIDYALDDGDNTDKFYVHRFLKQRAWEHDYFTSALPFAQKGPQVVVPLGDTAPLVLNKEHDTRIEWTNSQGATTLNANASGIIDGKHISNIYNSGITNPATIDVTGNTHVDLSSATSSTINDLRKAFKLQEWLEANARGGSRYIEHIYNIFGVKSSDSRLQRPEYLGGGKSTISISEVLQTSQTDSTPLGEMGGHGINVGTSNDFRASFEEHGFIIGLMSIRPQTAYFQGMPKHYFKTDKFDYFYPQFANIGEQEVKYKELYIGADQTPEQSEEVFGYVPRYSEYRFAHSTVHGDFRENLEYWHMGRKFSNRPHLNEEFIKMSKINRIFAYENDNTDHFYCHIYFKVNARRPLPLFNVPSL